MPGGRTTIVLACLAALAAVAGCRGGPSTIAPQGGLRGNGATVIGTIVRVEEDGDLVTNIPIRWVAADRADAKPFDGEQLVPPEHLPLQIRIGGKEFAGAFGCWRGGFRDGEWGLLWGDDDKLVVICEGQGAARMAGVSAGAEVRFAKPAPSPTTSP